MTARSLTTTRLSHVRRTSMRTKAASDRLLAPTHGTTPEAVRISTDPLRTHAEPGSRPHVLLVSPVVAPTLGGISTLAESLEDALGTFADVDLLACSSHEVRSKTRRVLRISGGRRSVLATRARLLALVVWQIVRRRPDIVHALTWRTAVTTALLPSRVRPTLVVHTLGTELLRCGRATAAARNFVIRRADGVVSISRYTAGAVHALTGVSPVVIPPSLGRRLVSSGDSRSLPVRVLSVGRLVERKGHRQLVEAVELARQLGADLTLTIAGGDGPAAQPLAELANQRSWLRVEVDASDELVTELYREANIFALLTRDGPREFEGFGIVFLEAAAAGLPLVSGRSGGAQEVVESTKAGYVTSTTEDVITALLTLCADADLRDRMGRDGRVNAERYAIDNVRHEHERFYASLRAPS